MDMSVQELLNRLDEMGFAHEFFGDAGVRLTGFSDPKDYRPNTVIWIGKPADILYTNGLTESGIALVMVKRSFPEPGRYLNVVILDDPKTAFMRLVADIYAVEYPEKIESTAVVSPQARIGKGCYIGHYCIVEDDVVIGDNCVMSHGVFVGHGSRIGNNCIIGQQTIIGGETNGSAMTDQDGKLSCMPNLGGVVIGDRVQIGAGCMLCRGTFSDTVVGDECMLNSQTSVGHNTKIGAKSMLEGRNTIHGNVTIGCGCVLISAMVKNRVVIGDGAKVGIGAVVLDGVPAGRTCFGNPARLVPESE